MYGTLTSCKSQLKKNRIFCGNIQKGEIKMKICNRLYSIYLWIGFAQQFFFNFRIVKHYKLVKGVFVVYEICFDSFSMTGKWNPSKSGLLHYEEL